MGQKIIKIDQTEPTVKEVLRQLGTQYPELSDIFHDSNPDLSLILDGISLYLPRDLDKKIKTELVIGPVVAGG